MSLDKLIAAATDYFTTGADVHRRALAGGGGKITDLSDIAPKKKKPVEPVAVEPVAVVPVEPVEPVAVEPVAVAPVAVVPVAVEPDDLDAPTISYEEDIRPALRAKSLVNRDAVVALLGKLNAKSGQELTADQYPAFLAGLKAI